MSFGVGVSIASIMNSTNNGRISTQNTNNVLRHSLGNGRYPYSSLSRHHATAPCPEQEEFYRRLNVTKAKEDAAAKEAKRDAEITGWFDGWTDEA